MLQCSHCYKYFFPDDEYEMNRCGGTYEDRCPKCEEKNINNQEEEE